MFESSVQNTDTVIASLQEWIGQMKQHYETCKITAEQRIKEYDKILEDQNAPPVERLRALVGKMAEVNDLRHTSGEMISLNYTSMVALLMRMFQQEATLQLNFLKAQTGGYNMISEEPQKYAQLKKELQRIKRTLNRDWKPLMSMLKEEIERRRKFLDANR